MTNTNLFVTKPPERPSVAAADFYCATVTKVSSAGIRILLDGETDPTTKAFKQLNPEHSFSVGDRVVAMLQSGTYVILGTLGYPGAAGVPLPINMGGTGQSEVYVTHDVSEICTTNSDFTITSATYAQWGKMAMLYVNGDWQKSSSSSSDDTTAFTMVQGKRPVMNSLARSWRSANAILYSNGNMVYHGLATVGTGATFLAIYLLA